MEEDRKRKMPISAESSFGQFVLSGLGEGMRQGLNDVEMKNGTARQVQSGQGRAGNNKRAFDNKLPQDCKHRENK